MINEKPMIKEAVLMDVYTSSVVMKGAPHAAQVWLKIGVQYFPVGSAMETQEEADWYAEQLRNALKRVVDSVTGS